MSAHREVAREGTKRASALQWDLPSTPFFSIGPDVIYLKVSEKMISNLKKKSD